MPILLGLGGFCGTTELEMSRTSRDASADDLTLDRFLGGRIEAWQPRRGFRAGIDSVLLAAAAPASPGERVFEPGCGCGVAMLCLGSRVGKIDATGMEIQESYAGLARRNAERNNISARVVTGCVTRPPAAIAAGTFDHVIANPPYFPAGSTVPPRDRGRATAMIEQAPLAAWTGLAFDVLDRNGWLTAVLPAGRQSEIISLLEGTFGPILIRPIRPERHRSASRILVRAARSGAASVSECSPLILHAGASPPHAGNPFTAEAEGVLRDGKGLDF